MIPFVMFEKATSFFGDFQIRILSERLRGADATCRSVGQSAPRGGDMGGIVPKPGFPLGNRRHRRRRDFFIGIHLDNFILIFFRGCGHDFFSFCPTGPARSIPQTQGKKLKKNRVNFKNQVVSRKRDAR